MRNIKYYGIAFDKFEILDFTTNFLAGVRANYFNSGMKKQCDTAKQQLNRIIYSFEYNFHSNCNFNSFEEKIITLKNKNYRPKEIAKILNCDVKRIYNCLYRIKTKK